MLWRQYPIDHDFWPEEKFPPSEANSFQQKANSWSAEKFFALCNLNICLSEEFIHGTCVNSGIEIPLSLQCKILKYKILGQLSMEVQDFFSLCKIYHPAWSQADCRNVEEIEQCLSDLCIKTGKHAFKGEVILWQISFRVLIEPSTNPDWLNCPFSPI